MVSVTHSTYTCRACRKPQLLVTGARPRVYCVRCGTTPPSDKEAESYADWIIKSARIEGETA